MEPILSSSLIFEILASKYLIVWGVKPVLTSNAEFNFLMYRMEGNVSDICDIFVYEMFTTNTSIFSKFPATFTRSLSFTLFSKFKHRYSMHINIFITRSTSRYHARSTHGVLPHIHNEYSYKLATKNIKNCSLLL